MPLADALAENQPAGAEDEGDCVSPGSVACHDVQPPCVFGSIVEAEC